jgi:hypothetical protein
MAIAREVASWRQNPTHSKDRIVNRSLPILHTGRFNGRNAHGQKGRRTQSRTRQPRRMEPREESRPGRGHRIRRRVRRRRGRYRLRPPANRHMHFARRGRRCIRRGRRTGGCRDWRVTSNAGQRADLLRQVRPRECEDAAWRRHWCSMVPILSQSWALWIGSGADPLVRAGPPGPALSPTTDKPTRPTATDQAVRPHPVSGKRSSIAPGSVRPHVVDAGY